MSDYEVTLVNDNSELHLLTIKTLLTWLTPPSVNPLAQLSIVFMTHRRYRQEFYVRFKGPEKSEQTSQYSPQTSLMLLQPRLVVVFGKFTWNFRISILTSHPQSVSSIAYSTLILTNCMSLD